MTFKKLLKYIIFTVLTIIVGLVVVYLLKPKVIEDLAIKLLYPNVSVEKKYANKYTIEIPEMYELMYIACSLTETFQNDPNLISNRVPEYLKEVQDHFLPFKEHELVKLLEQKLKGNAYSQLQPTIRFFSLNYQLNEDNSIMEHEIFHVNGLLIRLFKNKLFYYPDYIKLIEDFAKSSDFKMFYEKNRPYYNKLIKKFDSLCDIQQSWDYLEKNFTESYNSYRIIFSPLTGGFHNTLPGLKDRDTGLQQTWLFVSAPPNISIDTLSKNEIQIKKGLFTRELFTEMVHNYVNPLSDDFLDKIDTSIEEYKFWNNRKSGYSNKLATFNEYMTWATFSVFAKKNYDDLTFDTIMESHEKFMVNKRGFIHFKAFNNYILYLSKESKFDNRLHFRKMYPDLLNWMQNYNLTKINQ